MSKTAKELETLDISKMTKNAAITALIGIGYDFNGASIYWKENGTSVRGGVFQATLDWLANEPRTQRDLAQFVIDHGTKNEARWFGQRDAIRRLSIKIRGDDTFQDKAVTETQKTALKAIVEG